MSDTERQALIDDCILADANSGVLSARRTERIARALLRLLETERETQSETRDGPCHDANCIRPADHAGRCAYPAAESQTPSEAEARMRLRAVSSPINGTAYHDAVSAFRAAVLREAEAEIAALRAERDEVRKMLDAERQPSPVWKQINADLTKTRSALDGAQDAYARMLMTVQDYRDALSAFGPHEIPGPGPKWTRVMQARDALFTALAATTAL